MLHHCESSRAGLSLLKPATKSRKTKNVNDKTQGGGNEAEEKAKVLHTHVGTRRHIKNTQCTVFIKLFHSERQDTDAFMSECIK